ncbi:MAG TPA: hypothetical protein VGD64_15640, partial [Acidisarcina sp.]
SDFVRIEIASALKRNVAVIPVLVHDAKMPHPESLPDDLKDLCYRNSVELCHARWNSDVALLIKALKPYVTSTAANEQQPVHATVSVQLPPPHPAQDAVAPAAKKPFSPAILAAAAGALIVVAALAWFGVHNSHSSAGQGGAGEPQTSSRTAAAEVTTRSAVAPASPQQADDNHADTAALGDGEQATETRLEGKWTVPDGVHRTGNSLTYLEITSSENQLLIHAWGACPPTTCDWGTRQALLDGRKATAIFQPSMDASQAGIIRVATVSVAPGLNGLDVHVHNTFTGNGTSESNNLSFSLVPYKGN